MYRTTLESVLTYGITAWYTSCSVADRKQLQRVIKTAQKIIGCPLPSLEDITSARCLSRVRKIAADPSHPGWRHRCLKCRTNRLKNSLDPWAIYLYLFCFYTFINARIGEAFLNFVVYPMYNDNKGFLFYSIIMSRLQRHGRSKFLYVDLKSFSLDIRVSQEQCILQFLLPFTGQSCYTVYL